MVNININNFKKPALDLCAIAKIKNEDKRKKQKCNDGNQNSKTQNPLKKFLGSPKNLTIKNTRFLQFNYIRNIKYITGEERKCALSTHVQKGTTKLYFILIWENPALYTTARPPKIKLLQRLL